MDFGVCGIMVLSNLLIPAFGLTVTHPTCSGHNFCNTGPILTIKVSLQLSWHGATETYLGTTQWTTCDIAPALGTTYALNLEICFGHISLNIYAIEMVTTPLSPSCNVPHGSYQDWCIEGSQKGLGRPKPLACKSTPKLQLIIWSVCQPSMTSTLCQKVDNCHNIDEITQKDGLWGLWYHGAVQLVNSCIWPDRDAPHLFRP